jgi:hypothetical protein
MSTNKYIITEDVIVSGTLGHIGTSTHYTSQFNPEIAQLYSVCCGGELGRRNSNVIDR